MYGLNSRKRPEDEEKNGKKGVPLVPPIAAKAKGRSQSRAVAPPKGNSSTGQQPSGATPNKSSPQARLGAPKPASNSRFQTNSEGTTGDRARPSSSRTVSTTAPQKGGFPANPKQPRLPAPKAPGATNFNVNSKGSAAKAPNSPNTGLKPAGARTGTSLVTTEQPKPTGKTGQAGRAEPNYKARAEGKGRAAKDTASWKSEQARQAKSFTDAKSAPAEPKKGFRAKLNGAKFKPGGLVAGALTAIPEAVDVYDVATDDKTTGLDVANQTAEGAGRWASGMAVGAGGAKLGALGGSFIAPPFGTAVGGLAGGGLGFMAGYTGADKLIETGREWFGGDSDSPVDEVNARKANSGVVQRPPAEPAKSPGSNPENPDPNSVGTLESMPQQPTPSQQQPMDNNVARDGNSFSGGVVGQGYTVNGESQGAPNIGNPQSDQNQQAIESLMARTPEFGAGAGAGGGAGGGFRPGRSNRPNFHIGKDSSVDDRIERKMLRSATTPLEGAQNGQLTSSQRQTMENHLSGKRKDATTRATNQADNQTQTDTTQIRQQGQSQRAGVRAGIDQSRLDGEQVERGFKVRKAKQLEDLRGKYQSAETDEQRGAIAEQLLILNGNAPEQDEPYESVTSEQPIDPTDPYSATKKVLNAFDPNTGNFTPYKEGSGLPPISENPQAIRIAQDTSLSRKEREVRLRALGYQ